MNLVWLNAPHCSRCLANAGVLGIAIERLPGLIEHPQLRTRHITVESCNPVISALPWINE